MAEKSSSSWGQIVKRFALRWVNMVLLLVAYLLLRVAFGWDAEFDWSRFSDFCALGTLGLFLVAVYTEKPS